LFELQIKFLGQEVTRLVSAQPGNTKVIKAKEKEVNDCWTKLQAKVLNCEYSKILIIINLLGCHEKS